MGEVAEAAIARAKDRLSPQHFIDELGALRYATVSGRLEYSGGVPASTVPIEKQTPCDRCKTTTQRRLLDRSCPDCGPTILCLECSGRHARERDAYAD